MVLLMFLARIEITLIVIALVQCNYMGDMIAWLEFTCAFSSSFSGMRSEGFPFKVTWALGAPDNLYTFTPWALAKHKLVTT